MSIFVPRISTIEILCTPKEANYNSFWLIDLANDSKDSTLQFSSIDQTEQLNSHGVYQIEPGIPPTLRLLINDTARNNQTVIHCDQGAAAASSTTLFVLGKRFMIVV